MTFSATSLLPVSPTWINKIGTELIYLLPIVSWSFRGWFQRETANYFFQNLGNKVYVTTLVFNFATIQMQNCGCPRSEDRKKQQITLKLLCNPTMGEKTGNFRMLNFAPGKATYLLITVSRERRKNTSTSSLSDDKLQGHSTYTVNFQPSYLIFSIGFYSTVSILSRRDYYFQNIGSCYTKCLVYGKRK